MESIRYENIPVQYTDGLSSDDDIIDCYEPALESDDDSDQDISEDGEWKRSILVIEL